MSSPSDRWYVRKDDGTEYGPVSLGRLRQWAAECRLAPGNRVSRDRAEWIPVEELQALEMDWMARRPDGCEYGPFTIRAVPELFRHGILPADAELRNERTAETVGVSEALARLPSTGAQDVPRPATEPGMDEPGSSLDQADSTPVADATSTDLPDDAADAVAPAATVAETPACATDEQAALQATVEALTAECETLRAAVDEQATRLVRERETYEREREARETEGTRVEAELQATIADLQAGQAHHREEAGKLRDELDAMAHQMAFMKKNNASLLHDLDGRARSVRRLARAFTGAVLVAALLLTGWIRGLHALRAEREAGTPAPGSLPAAHHPAPERARGEAEPASRPLPAEAPVAPPRPTPRPAIAWPDIRVDGVIIRQADTRRSLVFEEPLFSRLTELSDWGRSTLMAVARELAPHLDRFQLTIEGHTDNVPLSSTSVFESNMQLGQGRADAVVELLTGPGGLPAAALRAASRGDRNPPYPNDSAANRRRNRTIVLHLEPVDQKQDRVAPGPGSVL